MQATTLLIHFKDFDKVRGEIAALSLMETNKRPAFVLVPNQTERGTRIFFSGTKYHHRIRKAPLKL